MAKKQMEESKLQDLKSQIRSKEIGRLYVFHGDEKFLLHHYFSQIRKQLLDELTESFNYHKLTKENFDLYTLADAVESLPMMAESTFVWVDDIDIFKFPDTDRAKLQEIFSDVPDYCTLVMTFETVSWKPDKKMKKLWDAIQSNAKIVEFPKQSQRALIDWVGRRFAADGKRISNDLCSYLIDITGGTMTALSGEIAKISAYSGADAITRSDIDAVTEPVMDAVVFQMTDLLSQGSYGAALENQRRAKADAQFRLARAEEYEVPPCVNRCYFFNPFSVEILQKVMARIIESWYADPREILLFFYYPSDDFMAFLMTVDELDFYDEIDCSDLFEGNGARERIMIFRFPYYIGDKE